MSHDVVADPEFRARLDALEAEAPTALGVYLSADPAQPLHVQRDPRLVTERAALRPVLDRLHADAWIRTTGAEGAVECFHDRVREIVVEELSAPRARRLHRALARALMAAGEPADAIAECWLAAGDEAEGLNYALEAAREAEEKLAFEQAVYWLKHAIGLMPPGAARLAARLRLANALACAGRGREAAHEWLALSTRMPTAESRRLQGKAVY